MDSTSLHSEFQLRSPAPSSDSASADALERPTKKRKTPNSWDINQDPKLRKSSSVAGLDGSNQDRSLSDALGTNTSKGHNLAGTLIADNGRVASNAKNVNPKSHLPLQSLESTSISLALAEFRDSRQKGN